MSISISMLVIDKKKKNYVNLDIICDDTDFN